MRTLLFLLATPLLLVSCIPESSGPQTNNNTPSEPNQGTAPTLVGDRLKAQGDRIARLETELHEMRLLFTNQLKRIEEVANLPAHSSPNAYQQHPSQQQPQQVVIMPNNPVVTHRWDQQPRQTTTASSFPRNYHIRSGDTLSQVAQAHGVPTHSIITANPGINPLRLQIGQQLTIPSAAQAAQYTAQARAQAKNYTVQPGDTLSEIAEQYGIGLSQLMAANPGINPTRMRIGKKLTIPSTISPNNQPPSGFASPPIRSLQREPQSPPQPTLNPQYKSYPKTPARTNTARTTSPSHKVLIKIPKTTTFGEIATNVGTDVDTLNRLNHCALSASSRIPANGTLYIPAKK